MKATLLVLIFLSLNAFAGREIMFIQAYEIEGPPSSPQSQLGVTISILNVSNIDQTVSWAGGIIPNRLSSGLPYTGTPTCWPHGSVPPHANATRISDFKYKLAPQGFITLWCSAIYGSTSSPLGGEGVVKMTIAVDEDRGAVMASGGLYIFDNQSYLNWGTSGGGPFQINGGRAF